MYTFETECYNNGFNIICGIDEVGRGALAGPVVSCAIIMPKGLIIDGIKDSKKLTPKKREELYSIILENAIDISYGFVDNDNIDKYNILKATLFSMEKAVNSLKLKPECVLIDGKDKINVNIYQQTIVGGDSKSHTIAAASIMAKVTRDRLMVELSSKYDKYAFDRHKGYGTKHHMEAIRTYGLTEIHRKTFCSGLVT